MRTSRFAQRRVAFALPQAEGGMSVLEVGREMGLAQPTFRLWKQKHEPARRRRAGMP